MPVKRCRPERCGAAWCRWVRGRAVAKRPRTEPAYQMPVVRRKVSAVGGRLPIRMGGTGRGPVLSCLTCRHRVYLIHRSTVPALMPDRASKRDFLRIPDFSTEELEDVLQLAARM